jgi:hypothetical protein
MARMRNLWLGLMVALLMAALLLTVNAPAIAGQAVDLDLVCAADGSGSIDDGELRLQRRGYANALVHPSVQDVIKLGSHGRIAVAYVEWGAPSSQHTIVDWTVIHDLASARAFGAALLAAPRAAVGYNSISEALAYSAGLIEGNDIDGARKVIDLSGDGPQIGGRSLDLIRDRIVARGMTINALAVKSRGGHYPGPSGETLEEHYQLDVIGGLGAFVMVADEETGFERVLIAKMVREIASLGAPRQHAELTVK